MIDWNRTRIVEFVCEDCDKLAFEVEVPWGAYIKYDEGCDIEIVEERAHRNDRPINDIVCKQCGCVHGLKKGKTKTKPKPAHETI